MKAFHIILLLTSINFINNNCPEYFNAILKNYCEALPFNNTHGCKYSNGICLPQKSNCASYTGTNEAECNSYKPIDPLKKCIIKENHCVEEYKDCSDYEQGITKCNELQAGTNQRCILYGGKCTAYYNQCTQITNPILCNYNIPSDNTHKCIGIVLIINV